MRLTHAFITVKEDIVRYEDGLETCHIECYRIIVARLFLSFNVFKQAMHQAYLLERLVDVL